MSASSGSEDRQAHDATLAAALFAIDPLGLGGVLVRARAGPARDVWMAELSALLGEEIRQRRLPLNADAPRLVGGLDLSATLAAGRPVSSTGLLSEAADGVLIAPSAERLSPEVDALLGAGLDRGGFGLVALDEGDGPDERASAALADRLALHIDLDGLRGADIMEGLAAGSIASGIEAARRRLSDVAVDDEPIEALTAAAIALGVASLRAPIFAARAARAAAAVAGRTTVVDEDVAIAARLVLAPRATQVPAVDDEADQEPVEQEPETDASREDLRQDQNDPPPLDDPALVETILAAALAALPPDVLKGLATGQAPRRGGVGSAGAAQKALRRGRVAGARPGDPRRARLDLVETLRRAAPWQSVRRRAAPAAARSDRLLITKDDLRVKRFKRPSETATIVVVDASGSAAAQRLAEAKGAVELLLGEAYVRRDHVALIAFRGDGAEVLLPPTRALARAKRALAGLPGGGATPLAAGLDAAAALADQCARRGWSPTVAVLTDGKANIRRDGSVDRAGAAEDASAAGRALAAAVVAAIVIDTAPRPQEAARRLADAMHARYLPMPFAGAQAVSTAVTAAQEGSAHR